MILHADATIERLASTTTVLGLFLNWDCPIEEAKLRPGDLLIICADGVTEAPNASHEEYGEARLLKVVQENRSAIQADDITAIVAAGSDSLEN